MKQKTKVEILNETVEYYKTHPRSLAVNLNTPNCLYKGPNGERCAFSRVVKDEFIDKIEEDGDAFTQLAKFGDKILKEEYQGHSSDFWNSVQAIHDGGNFWNNMEFTARGEEKLAYFIHKYKDK